MSVDYNIYIWNHEPSFVIKACLEEILNCPLKVGDQYWEAYSTKLLGLSIELFKEDEVDLKDRDETYPAFYHFPYRISVDYVRGDLQRQLGWDWRHLSSMIIANMLSARLRCKCVAVVDGIALAEFEPVGDSDEISVNFVTPYQGPGDA
ncbi:MAG: hypothetical protein KDB79_08885 [Acidobacteria bacterium]|nr:hypothetical protein [Acidobacteriota bacterium]